MFFLESNSRALKSVISIQPLLVGKELASVPVLLRELDSRKNMGRKKRIKRDLVNAVLKPRQEEAAT